MDYQERMKVTGFDSARLTAHSLRHTATTLSLLAGVSLQGKCSSLQGIHQLTQRRYMSTI
jgi:integrase